MTTQEETEQQMRELTMRIFEADRAATCATVPSGHPILGLEASLDVLEREAEFCGFESVSAAKAAAEEAADLWNWRKPE